VTSGLAWFLLFKSGMQKSNQNTIKQRVEFSGVGLHSGISAQMSVNPAGIDHGVVFKRIDSALALPVKASWEFVSITDLSTSVGEKESRVSTIEHLMAALFGLGIDNAVVEISGPEVPILDGSAKPFVEAFTSVGLQSQNASKLVWRIKKPFLFEDGGKAVKLEPADFTEYRCTISFSDSVIGRQTIVYRHSSKAFTELAMARTFCHYRDIDAMRRAGLALGGSLENAVVVTDEGVMNPDGLKGADEFVRHKLLDAIGDLSLMGAPLAGRVTLYKTGHGIHAKFMRELMKNKDEILELIAAPQADTGSAGSAELRV